MSTQIDMEKVVGEVASTLGQQIGMLTAELTAQRQANALLHAEIERLKGETSGESAPVSGQ